MRGAFSPRGIPQSAPRPPPTCEASFMPHFDRNQFRPHAACAILLLSTCSCSANLELPLTQGSQPLDQSQDAGESDSGFCPLTALPNTIDEATENADTAPSALSSVRLNELVIDPPGADGNNEFVEITGQPCADLSGLYLAAIEGDSESNPGNVDRTFNFQTLCGSKPCQLGPSGVLVVTATNGWQKPKDSTATWVFSNALVGGGLENGTTTLMLLACTTPPIAGSDWDPGETGVLQLPSTCRAVDSLSWLDRTAGDFAYSTTKIGPKPSPQGGVRCIGPDASPWWYFGALSSDLQGIIFSGALSIGSKSAAVLTPGMPNDCTTGAPVSDAATFSDASDSVVSEIPKNRPIDASTSDANPQETAIDAGQPSTTGVDGGSSLILSGASNWWEPDTVGTWPDSGATFDAATLNGSSDCTGSKGAPAIPQASCSLAANGRSRGFSSRASTLIGAIVWFMLRRRRVE